MKRVIFFKTYLDLRGSLIRHSLKNKLCIYFVRRLKKKKNTSFSKAVQGNWGSN